MIAALSGVAVPAYAESSDGVEQLEMIVVTAQRREENLQQLSLAITAVEGREIENTVLRPEELTALATGLNVAPSGGMTQIYIRGVGNLGGTSFAEGAVAFNVDQVYIGRPTAIDAVFFDLERVEVLKGPQGTLYGRNATGGAINVVTKKPKLGESGGSVSLETGTFDLLKFSGAVNLPFSETLAARVAVQRIKHDGYLSDGYNDQDTIGARAHLLWQPSEQFSLLLSMDYAHQGGLGDGYVPSFRTCGDWCGPSEPSNIALQRVGFFAPIILVVNDDGWGYQDNTFYSFTADAEIDLGVGTLSIIPSHRSAEIDALMYPSLFRGRVLDESKQDSLEVRFASNADGALRWVVGGFYYDERIDGNYGYSHGLALQAQVVEPDISNKSQAFFGQATYSVSDALRLTGGLRYTKDEKELSGTQRCYSGNLCGAPLGSGLPGTSITMHESDSWSDTSYRVGVEWDFGPQAMAYATVSTGFKSGGFYPAALDASFEPEQLEAYALGLKSRFLDNRVQVNAEVFYWDYTDHQESHVGTACSAATNGVCTQYSNIFLTENVGKAEIKGIDLDVQFMLTANDLLALSIGYLDAEATEFSYNVPASAPPSPLIQCVRTPTPPLINVDCSGNQMPRAPEWTGRIDYSHTFRLNGGSRIVANVNSYYSDEYWASIAYTPGADQESYTRSGASLTWYSSGEQFYVGAWINNIEDEAVAATTGTKLFSNTPGEQLRAPRTYGVRFGIDF